MVTGVGLHNGPFYAGWGDEDKNNTTPLNGPYQNTIDTALFSSHALSMHMYAKTH